MSSTGFFDFSIKSSGGDLTIRTSFLPVFGFLHLLIYEEDYQMVR
ncbi:hypothetical protein J2T18_002538 [Paenibacillus polymyxa]|nr:hypothetical protein [Paenibacillus polymyxa]